MPLGIPGLPSLEHPDPGPAVPGPTAPATPALPEFGTAYKPWETIDPSYSQDQWRAWESSRDANCPTDRPYRAERKDASGQAITECVEKPVDCPPGTGAFGDSQCLPLSDPRMQGGGGGRAGASGGGGGAGGGSVSSLMGVGTSIEDRIENELNKILDGATRFSPEVMAALASGSKAVEQGRIARETDAARESQAARGVAFSPLGAAEETQIRSQAASEFDQSIRAQQIQKAVTDFEDKMQALGNAQTLLNSMRQYALGLDSNNVQREGIQANVMIARERIAAELDMLMKQIGSNQEMQQAQIDFQTWLVLQKQILCTNFGMC